MRKGVMRKGVCLAVAVMAAWMAWGAVAHAKDIVWARDGDIDSLDPQRATSTLSRQLWYQVYDSLLEFNDQGELVPNLAKSWKVTDGGKLVTFKLHKGIKCSDGTPFNADDVVFTAKRALSNDHPSITKASWGPITQVEKVDPLTVRFHLSKPFAAFVSFMADQFSGMICDSMKGNPDFGTSAAVGTGPWKFVSWNKGSQIVLSPNPYYHNYGRPVKNPGPPKADQLIIKTIPEGQTRLAGLLTGQLSVIVPPIENVSAIRSNDKLKLYIARRTGQNMFIEFAVSRPPFKDARARRAVAEAINIPVALKLVFGDLVQREKCPLSPGVLGNDADFCSQYAPHYNPAHAKKLLAELGYGPSNPMHIIMMTWVGDQRGKVLQVFQNMLAQVGIKADIQVMDIGTLNARVKQENDTKTGVGTLDLMGWTWFDPDVLYLLWHSPGAYDGFQTPELDRLLEKTRTTLDHDKRTAAVKDVEKYLLSHVVQVPVYTPGWLWLYATRKDLKGFKLGPFNRVNFNDAHF